jgi:hypothetical protein
MTAGVRKQAPPACLKCGKKAQRLNVGGSLGTPDERYFCSVRCAAAYGLYRAAAMRAWCGVRYEDHSSTNDCQGPHGWWCVDTEDGCPECVAESEPEA